MLRQLLAIVVLCGGVAHAEELSKKEALLAEKAARRDVRLTKAPPPAAAPALTLENMWTHEALAVPLPTTPPAAARTSPGAGRRGRAQAASPVRVALPVIDEAEETRFDTLTRCHYTNQETHMDPRLLDVVLRASSHFGARLVEIVSGFRAPKYQLLLRKKGHEVARDSQHPLGHAVDFRLEGVTTKQLLAFVKSLHVGGVGFYPESKFVHADVGRVRYWRGH